ncbi:MAG TPA: DMT family transporter, partial [Solirubrobacteraceae bacterium]|nr:DMT family transporter [Solirubrobacteraceae bacterium]
AGAADATYILVAETVVRRVDPLLLSALIATGAAATFLAFGVARDLLQFTAEGWLWIAALATLCTVLPIVTFMMGMERVGSSTASIVSTFEPVVTVGLAVALYGETLGALQVLGGVLVLAAVIALQLRAAQVAAPAVANRLARDSV